MLGKYESKSEQFSAIGGAGSLGPDHHGSDGLPHQSSLENVITKKLSYDWEQQRIQLHLCLDLGGSYPLPGIDEPCEPFLRTQEKAGSIA